MTIPAESLRTLHRIHKQLEDLRDRLARGPKQTKASESNVVRFEEEYGTAKQVIMKIRVTADDRQLQLKTAEDRIMDLKRKRNTCNSNKEYQALIEQIAADEMATSVLSDEVLECLEKVDQQQVVVNEIEGKTKKSHDELAKLKLRIDEERKSLEVDIARLTEELNQAEASLPEGFRRDYDRIVNARRDDALACVDGEICGGCFQTITPQMLNDLFLDRPVFCKSCGRLLYLPEDRSVGS